MAEIIISKYNNTPVVTAFIDDKIQFISVVRESIRGNIYVGRVDNIVKNIDAAFIRYTETEIGYLPLKSICSSCVVNRDFKEGDFLRPGDMVIVQVDSEALKTKKTKLTTGLSISNTYTAITLGKRGIGASLKLNDEIREKVIQGLKAKYDFNIGDDTTGVIIRTSVIDILNDKYEEIIYEDSKTNFEKINSIIENGKTRTVGTLLYSPYSENPLNDHIDKAKAFLKSYGYEEVKIIEDSGIHGIPSKIEEFTRNKVWLKSGAYLIIEQLESFNAIDVNTGKAITGKKNIIDKVNMEAAEEIMRQIRIRNLTGMILIDFINMKGQESYNKLSDYIIQLSRKDPIHTNFIDITGLGIMELTRNKNDKSLKEILQDVEKAVDNSKHQ